MRKVHFGRRGLLIAAAAVCLALGMAPDARAFNFGSGDWTGCWDTTIGYGQGWRMEGRYCKPDRHRRRRLRYSVPTSTTAISTTARGPSPKP